MPVSVLCFILCPFFLSLCHQAGSAIFKNPRTKDAYAATINEMRAELAKVTIHPSTHSKHAHVKTAEQRPLRAKRTKGAPS